MYTLFIHAFLIIPLSLHEKQGRFFSIPKIGYVQLSIQETSDDDTPVVTQAHTTDCTVDGDSVRKSGFYLWGNTPSLFVKPNTFESWARQIPVASPNIYSVPLVPLGH